MKNCVFAKYMNIFYQKYKSLPTFWGEMKMYVHCKNDYLTLFLSPPVVFCKLFFVRVKCGIYDENNSWWNINTKLTKDFNRIVRFNSVSSGTIFKPPKNF